MVTMDPCGRLRIILMQLIDGIVAGAKPGNKEEFVHLLEETLPWLEKRAYELAKECRASPECKKVPCDLSDKNEIKKIFEKAYADLESKCLRYEEIKQGDPHTIR